MALVLGVNLSHDRAACLLQDGRVVVAVEEERLDRIKHSEGFMVAGYFDRLTKVIPMKAITYCLRAAGVGLDDLDLVVGNRPLDDESVARLSRELPVRDATRIRSLPMPSHHLAHAYASFVASPYSEAAILVVDGVGSRLPGSRRIEKHSIFVGEGTVVKPVAASSYAGDFSDFGLGLYYEYFTAKLGFITRWGNPSFGSFSCGGYTEGGKTMGLAPYGEPRPNWQPALRLTDDDVLARREDLDRAWASWCESPGGHREDGPPAWQSQFAKDAARVVQLELEEAMLHLVRQTHRITGKRALCLSGGVALNSVANQRILTEGPFEELFIVPAAGDAGVSVGAAAYGYHELLGGTQRHPLGSAATGRSYDEQAVLAAVRTAGDAVHYRRAGVEDVAELIAGHQVVAWVLGGSEIGPRALGQRSMLADPRHPRMRDYLNLVVKHREPFRPYAPSVLAEHAPDWFELGTASPYMLLVPPVRQQRRAAVPAITHVDGTARVQTVERDTNPEYFALIEAFHRRTGVPLVLNTSLNDAGEPIVETPQDAMRTFLRTEIDHLYLAPYLVSKRDRRPPAEHPANFPLSPR